MTTSTYERDEEVREIREVAEKMAERMSKRFVLNEQKVKRFQNASGQGAIETDEDGEQRRTDFSGPVLHT